MRGAWSLSLARLIVPAGALVIAAACGRETPATDSAGFASLVLRAFGPARILFRPSFSRSFECLCR